MSTTLYWKKVPKKECNLGHEKHPLKGILAKKYYDHDGSLNGCEKILTLSKDGEFIEALMFAGIEGAKNLYDDLKKYGELIIWIEG